MTRLTGGDDAEPVVKTGSFDVSIDLCTLV